MICAEIAFSATTFTIIFIILAALVGAFARRVTRDKCLKDFAGYLVTLERTDSQTIWGKVNVENTGLEFIYPDIHKDEDGHDETTYILYKISRPAQQGKPETPRKRIGQNLPPAILQKNEEENH
jgi:hypothetical protein